MEHLNARILQAIMYSHLCFGQPYAVTKLFKLHIDHGISPTIKAYDHHLQALVELGDFRTVKDIQKELQALQWTDNFQQRLAILRGQRSLGLDTQLEQDALADIEKNNTQPASRLLHALILLRLDGADTDGAKRLLSRFDLGDGSSEKGTLHPDNVTLLLAFKIVARSPEQEQLRTWWNYVKSSPGLTTDSITALLIQALCQSNLSSDAFYMIEANVCGSAMTSEWTLPLDTPAPGISTMNALLQGMSRQFGTIGLQRVVGLMRRAGIEPDDKTLEYIIEFVREHLEATPEDLSKLLTGLLRRKPDLRPSIGQLDLILAEAVKRSSSLSSDIQGSSDSMLDDPTAGLIPSFELDKAIEGITQSLRDRGIHSSSKGMANRLLYEASTGDRSNGIPSARLIWNEMIDRGYKPGRRHLLSMMQGYANANSMQDAEDVIELARQTGNRITRGMLMVLLVGWAKAGNLDRSEHAYESIRRLGSSEQGDGLDIVAVTVMLQAFYRSSKYTSAIKVLQEDLPTVVNEMDDMAISAASTTLLWMQEYAASLDLLRINYDTPNPIHRKIVRKIRMRLRHKQMRGLMTKKDESTLALADQTLDELRDRSRRTAAHSNSQVEVARSEQRRILDILGPEHEEIEEPVKSDEIGVDGLYTKHPPKLPHQDASGQPPNRLDHEHSTTGPG